MGIVREQAVKNSIISYAGVALGYINIIILFPAFFTTEQFGLIQLLVSVSFVYVQFAAVGLVNGITRFFPFFKTEDRNHDGFLSYIVLIGTAGFIVSSIAYLIFRKVIIGVYIENAELFTEYYYTLIPLSLFSMFFNILEALVRVVYKTVFATFLREVGLRLLTTAGIVLYIFKILNFDFFVYYYVGTYLLVSVILFIQLVRSKEFMLGISFGTIRKNKFIDLFRYGLYNLMSGAAMFVGQKVDIMMIGSMIGLKIVGVYSLYLYIATVIYIPMKALARISVPIISTSWKENNVQKINEIYGQTSLIQLVLGALIYIGVIINRHNLFMLLKKPEYIDNFALFYFIGIAILIDVSVGINSEIIANSSKFRYDAFFNVILFVTSVIMNLILIPIWGGVGAAIALVVTFFVFNFIKSMFLFVKYKMNPLSYKQPLVLVISAVCFLIGNYFPVIGNTYVDIVVRSFVTSLVFLALIYITKISDDINQRVVVYFNFVRNKISGK
ncbi:MAG: polysaccharide biosynthesis C-terminal domain-containing protein [Bacteroidetes bacterium]|nr:polysaccharide biosynthesis C-terminal domain-containing protein [Bacteroidota bacterium]